MKRKGHEIKKLVTAIRSSWRIAVVVIILMSISGYIVSAYGLKKHYIVTSEIYIESTDNVTHIDKTALAARLFSSPRMYDTINSELRTKLSYAELNELMSFEQRPDSQIIDMKIDCQKSSDAYKLAEITLVHAQRVLDDFEANAQLRIIEAPVEPSRPDFPDETIFTLCGAGIGTALAVLGIIIIWKLDNTITRADDLNEEYGVRVLGEIIDFDKEIDYLGR